MSSEMERVDGILGKTIDVMQEGRDEVFKVSENSRLEMLHREAELMKTQNLIKFVISEISELEQSEKSSRNLYLAMSKEDSKFSADELNELFHETEKMSYSLREKRELEKNLIMKRTTLEFHLKNAKELLKRAENITNKMGLALDYLTGSLLDELEEAKISRNLGIQIIKVQEDERKRISREIHDGPAQFMANVVMKADLCEKLLDKDVERAKRELGSLKNQVRDSIGDIRRIIFDLMPMSLEDLGLIPTLTHYIEELKKNTKIDVDFVYKNEPLVKLTNIVALSVFRVVQEGLNNVLKHSEAKSVLVDLSIGSKELNLRIQDDGMGIGNNKQDGVGLENGFGIFGMRERVRLLNGKFSIVSNEKGVDGTKLSVKIPLGT